MATNKNLSQPSASTPMVIELHKEAQQATSGSASLGVTGEVGVDAQPNNSIAEVDPGKSAHKDLLSQQQDKTQYAGDGVGIVQTGT
ncbi:hypothetical protein Tco_0900456 [Tanacetum coccineum]